jgi:hypothetical protein
MPCVGFEPTIAVFEWAKTILALEQVATVIGRTIELGTFKVHTCFCHSGFDSFSCDCVPRILLFQGRFSYR